MLAGIISTIYSLVMMVVLIGLIKEGVESQFCSVTTVFFCFVAGVFIVAALIHPQASFSIIERTAFDCKSLNNISRRVFLWGFFFRNSLVYFMECCTFLLYPPCRCFWFFTPSAICTTSTGAREKTSLSIHKTQLQNENQSSRDILVLLENGVGESLIYRFLFSFSRTVEPLVYNNKELHTSINFFIVACSVFEKLLNLCHKM